MLMFLFYTTCQIAMPCTREQARPGQASIVEWHGYCSGCNDSLLYMPALRVPLAEFAKTL